MCTMWSRYGKQVYDHSMSNMSTMIICVVRLSSIVLLKSGKVYIIPKFLKLYILEDVNKTKILMLIK